MKNRILSTLAVIAMSVLMFGCGNKNESQDTITAAENNEPGIEATQGETEKEAQSGAEITVDAVKNAAESDGADFEYEEVEGGISITDYNGMDEIVVIPETIEGYTVVEIGENAFANNKEIIGVKIADSISSIGDSAFVNCYGIRVVICGENLKTIGEAAFLCCEKLETIELNEGLESLGFGCFSTTSSLKEIYIPDSVVEINKPFIITENQNTKIITKSGSVAEEYAIENNISFEIK